MNNRIFGIIIITLGGIFLMTILYLLFFSGFNKPSQDVYVDEDNNNSVIEVRKPKEEENKEKKQIKTVKINEEKKTVVISKNTNTMDETDLIKTASVFVERFGSYSNQSGFDNLLGLQIFMSKDMIKWSDDYVDNLKEEAYNGLYYGIITKAVSQKMVKYDDDIGEAIVLVETRRREATMTIDNTADAFSQDILVSFIKEKGAWKVDKVNWLNN